MGKAKTQSSLSCFTPSGDHFAALSADGVVKVWNTESGKLLTEWRDSNIKAYENHSSVACTLIRKKRKGDNGTLVLGLGTSSGDVCTVNILSNEQIWISKGRHTGGTTALLFSNKGCKLYVAGTNGIVSEFDAESGELLSEIQASKKTITALALSIGEKILVVASRKIYVLSLDSKKELQRVSPHSSEVQHVGVTDSGKLIVSSILGQKQLQTWEWDEKEGFGKLGTVLSMKGTPIMLQCCSGKKDGVEIVLSVSAKGVAYLWSLLSDDSKLSTIKVKCENPKLVSQDGRKSSQLPVLAACLRKVHRDRVSICVVYGFPTSPQFNLVDVHIPCGEDICISVLDEGISVDVPSEDLGENANSKPEGDEIQNKRGGRKRQASNLDPALEDFDNDIANQIETQYDVNEPTMGEKLAALNLSEEETRRNREHEDTSVLKPPSADSVQILLKQALHSDDRALLLDCLYTQDEKVVSKSASLLNPSDALKLLNSLVSLIQTRGAVLACTIPWLRSLLLQHASTFMSQDSSVHALNSVYQLVESRTSTYESAIKLSNLIDRLLVGVSDDPEDKEQGVIEPFIYEVHSDEASDDAMETDEDSKGEVEDPESISDGEFGEISDMD